MSYDSPAPQEEKPTEPAAPTDPAEVDPTTGTDGDDKPVDNPAG